MTDYNRNEYGLISMADAKALHEQSLIDLPAEFEADTAQLGWWVSNAPVADRPVEELV